MNIRLGGDNKKPEATNHHAQIGEGGTNTADALPNRSPDAAQSNRTENTDYQWRTRLQHFMYEAKITDWLLAVFTLGLVIYTAQLVRVASKQTTILTTTDVAVSNSAQAAKDANKLNETALPSVGRFRFDRARHGLCPEGGYSHSWY